MQCPSVWRFRVNGSLTTKHLHRPLIKLTSTLNLYAVPATGSLASPKSCSPSLHKTVNATSNLGPLSLKSPQEWDEIVAIIFGKNQEVYSMRITADGEWPGTVSSYISTRWRRLPEIDRLTSEMWDNRYFEITRNYFWCSQLQKKYLQTHII